MLGITSRGNPEFLGRVRRGVERSKGPWYYPFTPAAKGGRVFRDGLLTPWKLRQYSRPAGLTQMPSGPGWFTSSAKLRSGMAVTDFSQRKRQ